MTGPNICLVMVTDGRNELLEKAYTSACVNLASIPILRRILVDDSGRGASEAYWRGFGAVVAHEERQGLAAAVRDGWRTAASLGAEYVFHMEDDFVFEYEPDLRAMIAVLDANPYLSQMSLKRQPVNDAEEAAGGFVQVQPHLYEQAIDSDCDLQWLEHRVCYSLNPHLVPRRVFAGGWPDGNEAGQTANLNELAENRFGIWGRLDDPPRVRHLGTYRAPGWML